MKKLIAWVVAAIMVLSMIPVMTFTASAERVFPEPLDGFWSVYRDPEDYDTEIDFYKPAPGYKYTSEGFQITSADYTNMSPKWTAQTSRPQDLTQGFYMQFRVDEFSYRGTDATPADEWIGLTISNKPLVSLGGIDHGDNIFILIRGAGDGSAVLVSQATTGTTTEEKGSQFATDLSVNINNIPRDEDGKEIYEFAVTYENGAYSFLVNGSKVGGSTAATLSDHVKDFEECYVGLSFHSGVKDGVASATILKQGTSAADAVTPTGDDEAEAEDNTLNFGPKVDISTIAENQPALLWDAHKTSFKSDPNGGASNVVITPTGDYTYYMKGTGEGCYFSWSIKSELTFDAADAPVFVMLMKNYMGGDGMVRYCFGDVLSADDTHLATWTQFDDNAKYYGPDEEYCLVVVNLAETDASGNPLYPYVSGRINSLRPEFIIDAEDDEYSEWEMLYMGMFRSVEEAHAYTDAYIEALDLETAAPTEPETDPETDPETNEQDTTADTADGTTAGTEGEDKTDDTTGCASVIGFGSVAVLAAAAAFVALKKKD